jgi:hypothetical protein
LGDLASLPQVGMRAFYGPARPIIPQINPLFSLGKSAAQ